MLSTKETNFGSRAVLEYFVLAQNKHQKNSITEIRDSLSDKITTQ